MLFAPAREPTAGSAIRGNMTSHVAPRAISSCLALRGDGNAALAGSFNARRLGLAVPPPRGLARAQPSPRSVGRARRGRVGALRRARRLGLFLGFLARRRGASGRGLAPPPPRGRGTLAAEIAKHDALYYLDADPEISDAAYDRLRVRLEALEEAHPGARRRDSPTGRVGARSADAGGASALESSSAADAKAHARFSALARAAHVVPMRSLSNVFTDEEARAWERKVRRALGGAWRDEAAETRGDASFAFDETAIAFVAEPKIDGASVSVTYVGGVMKQCVSRGDGLEGEDVQPTRGCVGVPKTLRRLATIVATPNSGRENSRVP